MQISERLRKGIQTERQKLREMSFRDKLWYIWEYCEFHILEVLIFLGILWVIGTSIHQNTYENELYCIRISDRSEQELNTDVLTVDFHDLMEFTDKQLVDTESSFISYGDDTSEYNCAPMTKISALVVPNEPDVMINDEESSLHYASLNAFSNLEELLSTDLLGQVKDRFYYIDNGNGISHAYDTMLDDTAFTRESNLTSTPCLLRVISNSKHAGNYVTLIHYMLSC